MSRAKNIRVPAGKEHEYIEDERGNIVHTTYGTDPEMPGTVLPSGIAIGDPRGTGKSAGFSVADMAVPQRLIEYGANGETVIGVVTVQDTLRAQQAPAAGAAAPQVKTAGIDVQELFGGALMAAAKRTTRKKAAKTRGSSTLPRAGTAVPAVKSSSTAVEQLAAPARVEQPMQAVPVKITGTFGTITQQFTGIFRDGICLVLYTRQDQLPYVYTPPPLVDGEPVALRVEYDGHIVDCFWGGIQFTLPTAPVTFTVLLAADEEAVDTQQPTSAWTEL
jgi:hypothetical protein